VASMVIEMGPPHRRAPYSTQGRRQRGVSTVQLAIALETVK
jgi:hypothetical protein